MRERTESWPSIRVEIELCPWHWRLSFWHDRPLTHSYTLIVGPLKVEAWF